jgi:hypothetical protein
VEAGANGALVAVSAVWYSLSPHLFWKSRKKTFSLERDRTFGTMTSDNFSGRENSEAFIAELGSLIVRFPTFFDYVHLFTKQFFTLF